MVLSVTWIVSSILIVLSGIHLYWLGGGSWGAKAAVPSSNEKPLFQPSKLATGVVAGALAFAGWMVLLAGEAMEFSFFSDWFITWGGWGIAVVFLLRAIGDGRWVGFTKRKKGTLFAKWDSVLFSPLCLFIGCGLVVISLN